MEKIQAWLNDFKGFFTSEVTKISNTQAELEKVRAELATTKSSVEEAASKLAAAQAENVELTTKRDSLASEITSLKAKLTEAENRATEALAAQGLRGDDMPAGAVDGANAKTVSQQVDALRKKLTASTDPKEKFQLSNQIRELLSAKN